MFNFTVLLGMESIYDQRLIFKLRLNKLTEHEIDVYFQQHFMHQWLNSTKKLHFIQCKKFTLKPICNVNGISASSQKPRNHLIKRRICMIQNTSTVQHSK